MPLYLCTYLNLFGYIGSGTPEDPGSDFSMSVWIDAPDEQAALDWGRLVLADDIRARYQHEGADIEPEGTEGSVEADVEPDVIEGWIEQDGAALERAVGKYRDVAWGRSQPGKPPGDTITPRHHRRRGGV